MRAARYHEYGEPQVLTTEDAPEPHAGPGQVRIRVQAASVNAIDWKFRAGYLKDVMPLELPAIPGRDAAGVVDEVGEGVEGVAVGDVVFGHGVDGTTAELAVLGAWAPVPATWSAEQAGGAGLAAATAVAALDAVGDVQGKTLLLEGAAGGVGHVAVQIAVARGARVIGTASPANHEFLRSLGAEPTTYGEGLADRVAALAPQGIDAALDLAGSGSLADLVAIVGEATKVASVADYNAPTLGAQSAGADTASAAPLEEAARLGAEGALTPHVQATFPLEKTAEAHLEAQGGHTRGKLVITL